MTGNVVWRTRSRMGVESDEPIDLDRLTADSGIGQRPSSALHDIPPPSVWSRLKGRFNSEP